MMDPETRHLSSDQQLTRHMSPWAQWPKTVFITAVHSRPAAAAAAPSNDRRSDLDFIAESYSGNEVGTVMFLSLPFH